MTYQPEHTDKRDKLRRTLYVSGLIFSAVFIGELVIMLALTFTRFSQHAPLLEALINAAALSFISTPVIYYWTHRYQANNPIKRAPKDTSKRPLIAHFIYLFLSIAFFLALLMSIFYNAIESKDRENISLRQIEKLKQLESNAQTALTATLNDLDFLADLPLTVDSLRHTDQTLNPLSQTIQKFASTHSRYFQIRILDINGFELIRVETKNKASSIIPKAQLQDKSNRYYFKNTLYLQRGQYYHSPFDLNMENDIIQTPFRPTIRLSRPIIDDNNMTLGVLIFNLEAYELLREMGQDWEDEPGYIQVLNSDSGWLLSPNKSQEWAFMFNHSKNVNFRSVHPKIWQQLKNGQFKAADGSIYTSATLNIIDNDTQPIWIVSHLPHETLSAMNQSLRIQLLILYLSLLLPASILLWITLSTRHHRTLASRQLLNQERQNSAILSSIKETYIAVDENWVITHSNLISAILTDHSDDLIGANLWEAIPELASFFYKQANRVLRSGQAATVEGYYPPKDIWLESRLYPMSNGLSLSFLDITAEIKMIERMKRHQNRMSEILNKAPLMISIQNTNGEYTFVNTHFAHSRALSPEEIIGNTAETFESPLEAEQIRELDQTALKSHLTLQNEETRRTPEGKKTYLVNRFSIIDTEQGRVSLCSISTDITSQKNAEKELSKAAAVFDSTADSIFVANEEFEIISINTAFIQTTGFIENDVLGKSARFLYENEQQHSDLDKIQKEITNTGSWRGELWICRESEEPFPSWISINRVEDKQEDNTVYIGVFSDMTALRDSQERFDFLAHHDSLTNLPNRLLFNDRLEHAIIRAKRAETHLAVLFIDLDHFKYINDTHGHPTGDKLLIEITRRLTHKLRDEDTVARLGGDEFVVLLESISEKSDAALVAKSLLHELSSYSVDIDDQALSVTASVGISLYPDDGDNVTSLIKNADVAMYDAKEKGRNNFSFYESPLTDNVSERLLLENDLRRALKLNHFVLHYQPQINTSTQQIIGMEALVRLNHPEHGMIPPFRFIPVAEESGIILELGDWIMDKAISTANKWYKAGLLPHTTVSINLAARQIFSGDLPEKVAMLIEANELPVDRIELEITESAVMVYPEKAEHTMAKVKALGVTLALDDFGTGYSSLGYLKRFPIDRLKIDRSFIRDIPHDEDDKALTKAIISMAKNLGIDVIAEGVETKEQADFLSANQCNEVQGYLYYKPLPQAEMEALLIKQKEKTQSKISRFTHINKQKTEPKSLNKQKLH